MDDARIEQIRREVMQQLGGSATERATHDLESRVAALLPVLVAACAIALALSARDCANG